MNVSYWAVLSLYEVESARGKCSDYVLVRVNMKQKIGHLIRILVKDERISKSSRVYGFEYFMRIKIYVNEGEKV
jgi:hypothetical protein